MSEDVLVVTVVGAPAVIVVAADNPELVGQVVVDYLAANTEIPEINVNVKRGVRESI